MCVVELEYGENSAPKRFVLSSLVKLGMLGAYVSTRARFSNSLLYCSLVAIMSMACNPRVHNLLNVGTDSRPFLTHFYVKVRFPKL